MTSTDQDHAQGTVSVPDLTEGRTYYLAWRTFHDDGVEIGCGPYLHTGRTSAEGLYQFDPDNETAILLDPDDITSVADPADPADFDTIDPTAADVAMLLVDEEYRISVIRPDGDRSPGFYTADLIDNGRAVVGVYAHATDQPGLIGQLTDTLADTVLSISPRRTIDDTPYLVVWS